MTAHTPIRPAPIQTVTLTEAAQSMKRIVEEIDGALKHGTWRDEHGTRLKDTPEWVALYNALSMPAPTRQEAGGAPSAWSDVLAERQRQMSIEGWTPKNDDEHTGHELLKAATAYVMSGAGHDHNMAGGSWWPDEWHYEWWKPTTPRRDLVKAAALILAEIERLDRAAPPQPTEPPHDPR